MENPLVLVIDDSQTIRKMVECHLSQAGYRVALAADAELGLQMARTLQPDLILLDHQLPGTTGDEVCRKLLGDEQTSRVPVVICSAMRNRAFAQYTEFANVIDQIPKPFTPELLKSGVANALQTGAMVVQAQRTGCAMPEAVGEVHDATLEGTTQAFPLPMVLAFLNNGQQNGRLTLESGNDRIRFALSAGRVQAVYSPTIGTERLEETLPDELADLGPLLALTLGEQQDPSMAGLVKMLERSLADPRRLRGLLRFQAASLTYQGLTGPPGKFSFEPVTSLPPMFQALPLQLSVAALLVDGTRHSRQVRPRRVGAARLRSPDGSRRQLRPGGSVEFRDQSLHAAGRYPNPPGHHPRGWAELDGRGRDGPRPGAGRNAGTTKPVVHRSHPGARR